MMNERKTQEERIRRLAATIAPDRELEFDETTRTLIKFRFVHQEAPLRKTPVSDALDAYAWEQKSDAEIERIIKDLLERSS